MLFCKSLFCLSRWFAWEPVSKCISFGFLSLALTHWPGFIPGTAQSTRYVIHNNYMYSLLCYCLFILFPWGWCRWDLIPVCVCIGIYVYIYIYIYVYIYIYMYMVEFCLLLWPLDMLSFDALLYFYDNKYVVILILKIQLASVEINSFLSLHCIGFLRVICFFHNT